MEKNREVESKLLPNIWSTLYCPPTGTPAPSPHPLRLRLALDSAPRWPLKIPVFNGGQGRIGPGEGGAGLGAARARWAGRARERERWASGGWD